MCVYRSSLSAETTWEGKGWCCVVAVIAIVKCLCGGLAQSQRCLAWQHGAVGLLVSPPTGAVLLRWWSLHSPTPYKVGTHLEEVAVKWPLDLYSLIKICTENLIL